MNSVGTSSASPPSPGGKARSLGARRRSSISDIPSLRKGLQKGACCQAKDALKALKFKLENVAYGGGAQAGALRMGGRGASGAVTHVLLHYTAEALQKKFENYARAESDDDVRQSGLDILGKTSHQSPSKLQGLDICSVLGF